MNLPKINDQFEHYKILSTLGEGAMGQVFLAEDLKLGRKVALKFSGTDKQKSNPVLLKRFENEARTLAALNHPNIVNVFDFGHCGDLRYLAMEYVQGDTLMRIIQKKAFGIKDSLETIRQVASGVGASHQKGVLHRDIKPANILIDENKKVKLVDFGIAKSLQSEDGNLTQADHFIGTINYIAPEILTGHPPSPCSDIFSIGVVFYELVTGLHPFTGENKFETMEKVKFQEITFPPDMESLLPESLKGLIMKMLSKDKTKRFQCTDDLIKSIDKSFEHLHPDLHQISIRPDIIVLNRSELRLQLLKQGYQENEIRLIIHQAAQLEDMGQVFGPDEGDQTLDTSNMSLKNKITISPMNLKASITSFENSKTQISKSTATVVTKTKTKPENNKQTQKPTAQNLYPNDTDQEEIPYPLYKPNFFKKAFVFLGFITLLGSGIYNYKSKTVFYKKALEYSSIFLEQKGETEEKVVVDTKQREISSLPSVYMDSPPAGSQFTFRHVKTSGDERKTDLDVQKLLKIKRSANGVISLNIKNLSTGKWSQARWSENVIAPPLRYYEKNGRNEKTTLPPNHKSIYPLNIGRKGQFRYQIVNTDGSFSQGEKNCEVSGHMEKVVLGKARSILVIQCQNTVDGIKRDTSIHYAPDLKISVKRESHWKQGVTPHYELWELVK